MNRTDMTRYIAERLGNLATNDDAERLYQFLRAADKIRATEAGELEIDGDIDLLAEYALMEATVTIGNWTGPIDAARTLMDDDLCETIHGTTDCNQEFADDYCAAHRAKYGSDFVVG